MEGLSKTDRGDSCRSRVEKWKTKKIVDMVFLQADSRQLEDPNQVIILLGCEEEFRITDEEAVILLCKKLSGNLKQIGEDMLSQIKDRDNLMEDAMVFRHYYLLELCQFTIQR